MDRLSRYALLSLVRALLRIMSWHFFVDLTELLPELIVDAKENGRYLSASARHERFMRDPDAYIDQKVRRIRAAKRSARRRKRASK